MNRRGAPEARRILLGLNRRKEVITALAEALNADNGNVEGKGEIVAALRQLKAIRPVVRALEGDVPSTRYAAANALYRRKVHQDRARQIAVEWIKDANAPGRYLAIQMAATLDIAEALPAILELLDKTVAREADFQTARAVMVAVEHFQPDGVVDRVLRIAADPRQHNRTRCEAVRTLSRLKATPADKLRALALDILPDRDADHVLRMLAAMTFRENALYNADVDAVLRGVLLDQNEKKPGVQRECLKRLGAHAPLAELTKLLRAPGVYGHPYFAIRSDVATALAGLHLKDAATLDILRRMLVDVDAKDTAFIVRREAWCSLWLLTGAMSGIEEQELFGEPYEQPDEIDRSILFRFNRNRPGITAPMVSAMDKVTPDLEAMKKIRAAYANSD